MQRGKIRSIHGGTHGTGQHPHGERTKQARTALARLQEKASPENPNPPTNPFDIFDEHEVHNAFKIRKEDDARLNEKWWESWRSAYGQGLAVMLGGLIALWIFSMAIGWIV